MSPGRREILEKVASGELTPEEAELMLGHVDGDAPPQPRGSEPEAGSGVSRVRIEAGFGAIAIVGDPSVSEAEIEGLHSASIDGDTLVISGDATSAADIAPGVFAINLGGRRARRVRIHRSMHSSHRPSGALRVRLNPRLELDARLDAGPLAVSGMEGRIRARSSAGPITVDGVQAPIDIHVNAGAIRIAGLLVDGESRVRSDAGAIKIELDAASSVRVTANALLGKVVLPDVEASKGFGSSNEAIIGDGAGTLRVETAMGSINVSLR